MIRPFGRRCKIPKSSCLLLVALSFYHSIAASLQGWILHVSDGFNHISKTLKTTFVNVLPVRAFSLLSRILYRICRLKRALAAMTSTGSCQ